MVKKTNAKHLIERIHKLAAPPPAPPVDYTVPVAPVVAPPPPNLPPSPAPLIGTPEAPTSASVPKTTYTSPRDVIKMQEELINLARTVTKEIGAPALAAQPGQTPGQPPQDQQEAAGRLAFSNFITEHYIRQSNVPAVEYDPDPSKTEMSQKNPSKPTRMNVVMDTMSRIGGPKNEFKSDGIWGPRTNAALRNAYALAFALLKMAHDFKLDPRTYSQADLNKLKELIPLHDKEISFTDKVTRAKEIISHLQAIRNLFTEVKNHILQKPIYRSYIEGTQPYATYQKGTAPSSQMLQDLDKKFVNMKVTGTDENGQQVVVPITVNDLATLQAFQLWQQKNLPKVPLSNILSQIKQHLDETDVSRGAA